MDESLPQGHCLEQKSEQILKSTESPFTWMPNREGFEDVRPGRILEKCVRRSVRNLPTYKKFMCRIFELANKDDPSVFEVMRDWEGFYGNVGASDHLFTKYKNALEHVMFSTKAHLLLKTQDYNQVEQLVESIEKCNDGSDNFKACINGLKAKFFIYYCNEGRLKALPYAKEALRLDPDEVEWIKTTGKTMRNIRNKVLKGSKQSRYEELELFKKCVSIEKTGGHLVLLGNAYLDVGHYLEYEKREYKRHRCDQHNMCGTCLVILKRFSEGVECYNKAIEVSPKQSTYYHLVRGIIQIPPFYRYKFEETAETCVNKMLDDISNGIIDDSCIFHVYNEIGNYYMHIDKNPEEGLKYKTKSAEVGGRHAHKDLICFKYSEDSSYDPHEDVKALMDVYQCGPMMVECICQLASYYLSKNDLLRASECILQVKEYDPSCKYQYVKSLRSWFRERKNVNLLKEIKLKVLSHLHNLGEDTSEEKKKLMDFMKEVGELDPDIAPISELKFLTLDNLRKNP